MDEQAQQPNGPAQSRSKRKPSTPLAYDSNPFTAAWSGVQKLFGLNLQAFIGLALFNVVLFVILGVSVLAIVMAGMAFASKHITYLSGFTFPAGTQLSLLNSMNDSTIYATWIVGLAICIGVVTFLQSLQLNLTIASAKGQELQFGQLLKRSLKPIVPLVGLVALVVAAVVSVLLVFVVLGQLLGYITIALGIVGVAAAIYAGLRISFAAYSIIDEGLSPLAALHRSWALTDNHIIETIGSAAVASLTLTVPSLVLTALARLAENAPLVSATFSLLDSLLVLLLVATAGMAVAERYTQLQAVANKQLNPAPLSPLNYAAVIAMFVVAPLMNALSPQMPQEPSPSPSNWYDASSPGLYDDQHTPDSTANHAPKNYY